MKLGIIGGAVLWVILILAARAVFAEPQIELRDGHYTTRWVVDDD